MARALITNPKLILADEPTGALDSKSTDELLRLFSQVNRGGQTILMVTHSVKAASHASRVLFIKDGRVFHQIYRGQCSDQELTRRSRTPSQWWLPEVADDESRFLSTSCHQRYRQE